MSEITNHSIEEGGTSTLQAIRPNKISFSWRLFWSYTGPGWLMSMAYLDPGNLEADLQSGAYANYKLLYVVLISTIAGGIYQILAARLGACTGKHLAQLCRSQYPPTISFALWLMTEIAIIGSDVQEVLGSAIAFQLLFNFPLWFGCLLTAFDTFTFLALHRNNNSEDTSKGNTRYLEMFFLLLISTMCFCFFGDFVASSPDISQLAKGIIDPELEQQDRMQAVGMLGAILMPHNIFLHSALVQSRHIDIYNTAEVQEANFYFQIEASAALFVSFLINSAVVSSFASAFYSTQCASLSTSALSAIAGTGIQTSCIPVTAALASNNTIYDSVTGQACHNTPKSTTPIACLPCYPDHSKSHNSIDMLTPGVGYCQEIGLGDAGEAIRASLGKYAKVIWAVGLLASGQASTMTGTYAGQFVMEGFLNLKVAAWKRVALTRGMALIPAILVAIWSQQTQTTTSDRVNELLNVLQSFQLPFALIPLLTFVGSEQLMTKTFVNGKWLARGLVALTALLCGLNYGLVYAILESNGVFTFLQQSWVYQSITFCCILVYMALVMYLTMVYPMNSMYYQRDYREKNKNQDDDMSRVKLLDYEM